MRHFFPVFLLFTFTACSVPKPKGIFGVNVRDITIPNEVSPVIEKSCFNGAYYRKLVSSHDYWLGIIGTVVLPTVHFDEARVYAKKPGQYLDNPSVYLGGSMGGQETDIGLAWEVVKEENGQVSKARKAFRPFLRRTEHASGQKAVFENAPAEKAFYWYPGEEVTMSLLVVAKGKIRFVVEGAGKRFEREFSCDGYALDTMGEFKRVNAIDQVANEGKPVQATKTQILNAQWKATSLYRTVAGKLLALPFKKSRYTEMMCPSSSYFDVKASAAQQKVGAESISISGGQFR